VAEYRLCILGPVRLTGPNGVRIQSVLQQPKRTAVLAYLAMAPASGRTRAEMCQLFWPDRAEDDARHALSQAVYYLRRSLGSPAIIVEGEMLRLNTAVVATDVGEFQEHLACGRLEEAVALYDGDLLEQWPSIAGFDQWLDGAREKLRQQMLDALGRLSAEAEAAGDHEAAIRWADRAHAIAPYREAPVRRLISLLIAAGEPVRAREVYDRFAVLLRDELDMEPSPETAALLQALPPPATPAAYGPVGPPRAPSGAAAADHPDPAPSPAEPLPVAARGKMTRVLRPAAVLALIIAAAWFSRIDSFEFRSEASTVSANRIGIFPFLYRGHPELAYLGEGIPELIGISIQSLGRISILDPRALAAGADGGAGTLPTADAAARARELGAEHYVVGSVVEAGGAIHVTARLHRTDGDLVAIVSERAKSESELFDLVDELVRQLVGGAFPGMTALERSAAHATRSLPALRHFLRGERLFRDGRYRDAVAAFDNAVAEDSAFALAHYRSAIASLWSAGADFDRARISVARALAYRDRVSALDRDLFLALDEFLRGRLASAERLYESVLMRQPENIEAWFQLAEARFHYGGLHGRSVAASEEAWRQVLALSPDHHAALVHLSAIAAQRRDPLLDSLDARVNGVGNSTMLNPQVRALRVFAFGSEAERRQFIAELGRYAAPVIASTAAYAGRFLGDPAAAARIARVLTDSTRAPAERAQGYLLIAHFALARGKLAAAREALQRARELDPGMAEPHRLFLATIPPVTIQRRSRGARDSALVLRLAVPHGGGMEFGDMDGSVESGMLVYGRALTYHLAGGEDGALLAAARRLHAPTLDPGDAPMLRALARGLAAERYLSLGDTAAAREELAGAIAGVERWYEHLRTDHLRSLARERFLLAELEIAAGRDGAAELLLLPFGENAVAELPYLAASLIRLGEVHERSGNAKGAIAAYSRVRELWSDADPALQPIRAEIEARLEMLGT